MYAECNLIRLWRLHQAMLALSSPCIYKSSHSSLLLSVLDVPVIQTY